uniref:Uncharacterized protein n=1 Tax=Alexandrium monilatum TaxID=311494 RepID=A0A7S4S239_9DINO|mmetsp:Transcript_96756/g.288975  ORF Transcript_96756/g.288975 Transcript_96756/m.288975 type:complete len:214 (+) Transcript_96756:134-775(+)
MGQGMGRCCRDRCVADLANTNCDEMLVVDGMEPESISQLVPTVSVLPPVPPWKAAAAGAACSSTADAPEVFSFGRRVGGSRRCEPKGGVPETRHPCSAAPPGGDGPAPDHPSASSSSRLDVLHLPGRPTAEVEMHTPWVVANELRLTATLLADWHPQDGARGKSRETHHLQGLPPAGGEPPNRGELQPRTLSRAECLQSDRPATGAAQLPAAA